MQTGLTILLMVAVGAVIGGLTNSLAIMMLFRPYKPMFLGKRQIPFTPGLIPKRRSELAEQMGKIVVNHLLTPESIKRKFVNGDFQKEAENLAKKEFARLLNTEKTPAELLGKLGFEDGKAKAGEQLDAFIEKKYETLMDKYRHKPIKEVLAPELLAKAESRIPVISEYIAQKGEDYFSSIEGKMRIQRLVDDFVKGRSGVLGNMLQMVMGNVNLADKIQPEIIKFLRSEGTKDMIAALLQKEWMKVLDWEAAKIEEQFERENIIKSIKLYVRKIIKADDLMDTPLSKLAEPFTETLVEKAVPGLVGMAGEWLSGRMDIIMERLHLADIIKQQVESFSVERLEEMVLSISRRELKMITYLGALLGGIIGLLQGFLVLFI
ncbi:DUF445 domain-containing protein [Bacillus infantis]|uniref:DUF445 domain-containing protein n=1 Tax=Bacillus infantis TaxID=324767 RepID=UPI002155A190|nr:DUF445 family protein [Bacillus infantis]MCR6609897.1 DUF445 family protein [Bacillus infantis]